MQIYDLQFDNGQGEIEIDEAAGVLNLKMTERNPSYPGGAQFNVPLDPIIEALIAKVQADGSLKGKLEAWGLKLVEQAVDSSQ